MSGLARAAKKHWKRKVKAFKKYWKVVAIAVVAYFTFGLAMGAMAPAAGTTAAGAGAAAGGTGVMTATAAAGTTAAASTAAAATVAGIETVTVTAAAAGGGLSAAGAAGAIAGGAAAASAGSGGGGIKAAEPAPKPVQSQQPAKTGLMDKAKAGWKEMSFSDKLLLAKAGVDVASAVTAPSAEEEAAAAAKWQGAFYGQTAEEAARSQAAGGTQFVTQQTGRASGPPATRGGKVGERELVPGGAPPAEGQTPMPGQQAPTQPAQFQSTAEQPEQQQAPAAAPEQVTNMGGNRDLFAQRAPGVRYLV